MASCYRSLAYVDQLNCHGAKARCDPSRGSSELEVPMADPFLEAAQKGTSRSSECRARTTEAVASNSRADGGSFDRSKDNGACYSEFGCACSHCRASMFELCPNGREGPSACPSLAQILAQGIFGACAICPVQLRRNPAAKGSFRQARKGGQFSEERASSESKHLRCSVNGTPTMQSPLLIGLIVFAVIIAGALAGWAMRKRLPANHLTDETKSLVSLSMAIVATLSALVLGLLISNANSSFTALGGEVTTLSAQLIRLDQVLRRYGPETKQTRELLRQYVEAKTADLFPDDQTDVRIGSSSTYELLQQVEDSLLALKPANSRDQWWLGQALTLAGKIGDARWLLAQRVGQGTPKAFMVVLVFWLTLLFASFGLFAPPNLTSAATLTVCALAVAAAVAMILELENGFRGVVHISPEPMRQAVTTLQAEARNETVARRFSQYYQ
jgi:uncharacterized membrane protein